MITIYVKQYNEQKKSILAILLEVQKCNRMLTLLCASRWAAPWQSQGTAFPATQTVNHECSWRLVTSSTDDQSRQIYSVS